MGHSVVLRPVGDTGTMVQVIAPPYHPRIVDDSSFITDDARTRLRIPESTRHRAARLASLAGLLSLLGAFLNVSRTRRWPRIPG